MEIYSRKESWLVLMQQTWNCSFGGVILLNALKSDGKDPWKGFWRGCTDPTGINTFKKLLRAQGSFKSIQWNDKEFLKWGKRFYKWKLWGIFKQQITFPEVVPGVQQFPGLGLVG